MNTELWDWSSGGHDTHISAKLFLFSRIDSTSVLQPTIFCQKHNFEQQRLLSKLGTSYQYSFAKVTCRFECFGFCTIFALEFSMP